MSRDVLLVLADEHDAVAASFVARHRAKGARLLAPRDLSSPGWIHAVGAAADSVAVARGERIAASRLRGVLTRLPCVAASQLPHVVEIDRDYVAAEMSAFLLAWLHALPCPVWNRPVAPSLSGPSWSWPQWRRAAAEAGVPVAGDQDMPADEPVRCSVVGRTVAGAPSRHRRESALRLARHAGVDLLDLLFDGADDDAGLVGVDLYPDVSRPALGDALLDAWP